MLKRLLAALLLFASLLCGAEPGVVRIPAPRLENPVLAGSRIVSVNRSRGKVFAPGQLNPFPRMASWQADSSGLCLRYAPSGKKGKHVPLLPALFPIQGREADGSLLVDMAPYFREYPLALSAIPPKMLEKDELLSSRILKSIQTEDFITVTGEYRFSSGLEVTACFYLLFLPESPMPVRKVDPSKAGYNGDAHSYRWDFSRRGRVDFYVDRAFPADWYPYIKEGIEDWNKAFEAIGLGPVLAVHPAPEELDTSSPLVNMVRFMDVEEANAKGDVLTDPRSGEILQADILWWRSALDLMKGWRYVQTGAADPQARLEDYPMEILGPMIRYSICHEMGHSLGLSHNMGASWAYPSDSLRSVSFTRRYGTAASVMDYARFNHLATAADVTAGVSLLPPRLGPYDYYAIALGYGPDASLPAGEYCYYAPFISAAISPDPSAQAESLGNDLLLSSRAGLRNCRALLGLDGLTEKRLRLVKKQYYRYIWLLLSNIGGTVEGQPVRWRVQRETLQCVLENLAAVPPELKDEALERSILKELDGNFLPERVLATGGKRALKCYQTRLARLRKKYGFV